MSTVEEVIGLKALDPGLKAYDPQTATLLDEHDPLKEFRQEFRLPTNKGIKATAVQDTLRKYRPRISCQSRTLVNSTVGTL